MQEAPGGTLQLICASHAPPPPLPPPHRSAVSYTVTSSLSSAQPSGNAALLALQGAAAAGGGEVLAPAQVFLHNLCPFYVSDTCSAQRVRISLVSREASVV